MVPSVRRLVRSLTLACLLALALAPAALGAVSTGDGVWTWQNPLPQGNVLNDGFFLDSQQGWFVGAGGTIVHTSDGGESWVGQPSGTPCPLTSVCFSDAEHGWATGNVLELPTFWLPPAPFPQGLIATTDGGKTWHAQSPGFGASTEQEQTDRMNLVYRCIRFVDNQHGWAVGSFYHDGDFHALILGTSDGGAHWRQEGPQTHGLELSSVRFADALHGWAVGERAGSSPARNILATSDGGSTWTLQDSGVSSALDAVSFVDAQHGWAVGHYGQVTSTTDGGSTWVPGSLATTQNLLGVTFSDADHGVVMAADGAMFDTADGGATWSTQDVNPPGVMFKALVFADAQHGWIVGAKYKDAKAVDCYVLSSGDGGQSWNPPPSYETADLKGVSFVSRTQGWAVGAGGALLSTDDGGARWTRQATGTTGDLRAVKFVDPLHGWAVGDPGILATADAGLTWQSQSSLFGLQAVSFVDALHGWAVAGNSAVATSDGGVTWTEHAVGAAGSGTELTSVSFVDTLHGWAAGHLAPVASDPDPWRGCVYVTSDGGVTWQLQLRRHLEVRAVCFADALYGWIGEGATCALHTTDGGDTWQDCRTYSETHTGITLTSLTFIDRRHGWAVGTGGVIRATSDGEHWFDEDSGTARDLAGVSFVDEGHGWVVGAGGAILEDPNLICLAPAKAAVVRGRIATLKYKVSDAAIVRVNVVIRIRNSKGRMVKRIVYTNKAPNTLLSARFRCWLKKGAYHFYVTATDTAGNRSAVPAVNHLRVR